MKVALYARVSKADESQSPENQLLRLHAFAASQGWTVVREYVDRASGANPDRPALEELMAAARGNQLKCVVMTKIDRMARSTINLYSIVEELTEKKVGLVCIDQPEISTTRSMGKLLLAVLGGIAEFERDLIRDRTIDGLERARARGKRLGRPPMRIDVERARELRSKGLGYRKVAEELGVSRQTLWKRLRNEGVNSDRDSPSG
jgi:putative DNA-invertase from lambdoid prophage Rac